MLFLPSAATELLMSFSCAFSEPTFRRMLVMIIGAILTPAQRTVTAIVTTMQSVTQGHFSSYHRLFSRAKWSLWPLGRILARAVLKWVPDDRPVVVAVDDTTAQHRGKRVYGKGCHHDAVRSAHRHVVFKWGHRWIVLAVTVRLPFVQRVWALPVLAALYRPKEVNRAEGRRHKTAPLLALQLITVLLRWFPQRRFIFLGDGGYASHELARFCHCHGRRATLVSRFHGDARLYDPPPPYAGRGRPRTKGDRRPAPREVVARSTPTVAVVSWFGGGSRRVGLVSGTGLWYKAGRGLVPVRWVHVRDLEGTHREEYFYTTDLTLTPEEIVSLYTRRWPIETTFQEVRRHLGFEQTRQWRKASVLRMGPLLLGLYSVVCLIWAEHTRRHRPLVGASPWYAKQLPTFTDAITTVRILFWRDTLFKEASWHRVFQKLPPSMQETLLVHLARAA